MWRLSDSHKIVILLRATVQFICSMLRIGFDHPDVPSPGWLNCVLALQYKDPCRHLLTLAAYASYWSPRAIR